MLFNGGKAIAIECNINCWFIVEMHLVDMETTRQVSIKCARIPRHAISIRQRGQQVRLGSVLYFTIRIDFE